MRRPIRNALLLGIVVGLVVAVVRALRAEGSGPGAVEAGPLRRAPGGEPPVEERVTSTSVLRPPPEASAGSGLSAPSAPPLARSGAPGRAEEPPPDVVAPVDADPLPDVPATAEPEVGTEARGWEEPRDGACPPGFPVKVKESSGIFHVPEGAFYDRTTPDRCYPSAAAAEADGFRASKR